MLTLNSVTLLFSPYAEHRGILWSRDCTTPTKLDSVSTLIVIWPALQVAVTMGENMEDAESMGTSAPKASPRPLPPSRM